MTFGFRNGQCFFCGHSCSKIDFCRTCQEYICVHCVPNWPTDVPDNHPHDVFNHIEDPILRECLREKAREKKT